MSRFYDEDLVALKGDPTIIGTVAQTWSSVDPSDEQAQTDVYFHKNLPRAVKGKWIKEAVLERGYVIIEFQNEGDGYCLVEESSLRLIDRSLVVGDVVKRKASDHQSGMVISTSMQCRIRPCCSLETYRDLDELRNAQKHFRDTFPTTPLTSNPSDIHEGDLSVSASDLKHWNTYREDDFLLHKDCVGQIVGDIPEVTLRLEDGSLVTVEDPLELEEPFYYHGSDSLHLAEHLRSSGFRARKKGTNNNIVDHPTDGECHPGQIVRTKKANLRRGKWKRGSYNPNIEPYGLVVDVRSVGLEVRWLFRDSSKSIDQQPNTFPPTILDTAELEMGGVVVYDRNKRSENAIAPHLPRASYSPDIGFGHLARLRGDTHPRGNDTERNASLQTDPAHNLPPTETQGFDMNVFQVSHTATQAMILWQDGTMSDERTVTVDPYDNVDEYEVWPGDRVSYVPSEDHFACEGRPMVRLCKVGIVQSVHSSKRTANVRWFLPCQLVINEDSEAPNKGVASAILNAGDLTISNEITEVSLYEIRVHPALDFARGAMVLLFPDRRSLLHAFVGQDELMSIEGSEASDFTRPTPISVRDSFGEIVDLCLDGDVVVRLALSPGAPEVKVPMQRVTYLASGDTRDDDQEDIASDLGGEGSNKENNDEIWETDDEFEDATENVASVLPLDEDEAVDTEMEENGENQVETAGDRVRAALERTAAMFGPPAKPAKMVVLPDEAPQDHHFIRSTTQPLNGNFIGRVVKEQNILFSALPEGVFARTWENRLDLLRILLVGPTGTPYEHAPFVVDMHYPSTFPTTPPDTYFHSWTHSVGRVNPNLYEDGTICLSLLGTWHANEKRENWSPAHSSVLQIIMSIVGLVLVEKPYYNEAGFEPLIDTPDSFVPSALYSEKAYILSKGFIKTALSAPPEGLEDVINWLYKDDQGPQLLDKVIADCKQMQPHSEGEEKQQQDSEPRDKRQEAWAHGKLSAGAMVLLKRNLEWLEGFKADMEKMEGVE